MQYCKGVLSLQKMYAGYLKERELSASMTVRKILGFSEEITTCYNLPGHPKVPFYFCDRCPKTACKEKQKQTL